jgi:hypothetical protein
VAGVSEAVRQAIVAARHPSREAVSRWRASDVYGALAGAFEDCPPNTPEPAAERAEALLGDGGWAAELLAPLVDALTEEPLFEPPFKVSRDRLRIGAILFQSAAVSLTGCVTSAAALAAGPPPASLVFTGRVTVTRTVRAGGAVLRRWRAPEGGFEASRAGCCVEVAALPLEDGLVHRTDGRVEAQLLTDATRDVVTLVATIAAGADPLMREHAISGGAMLRVAHADDRPSRAEMLLALLRVAGRSDAAAQFDGASRDPAFALRWAAMREWLALDAGAALPRLAEMAAGDPHPDVRAAAIGSLAHVERRVAAARCPG